MERYLEQEGTAGGDTPRVHLKGKQRHEREDMYSSHQFQAPSSAVDMKGD